MLRHQASIPYEELHVLHRVENLPGIDLHENSSVVHFRTYTLAPALSVDVPPNRMPTIIAVIVSPASSCTPLRFGTIAQGWMEKIPGVPEREALVNS